MINWLKFVQICSITLDSPSPESVESSDDDGADSDGLQYSTVSSSGPEGGQVRFHLHILASKLYIDIISKIVRDR